MNWDAVKTIFATDMKNTLRDRRTWLAMVVIPLLLVPAMLIAAPSAVEQQTKRLEASPPAVAIVGAEEAPDLVDYVKNSGEVRVVDEASPQEALDEGRIKAILRIQPDLKSLVDADRSGEVVIEYDAASMESEQTRSRLHRLVSEYSQAIVARRLTSRGIDPALLSPVLVHVRNVAPEEKVGGYFLSLIMPMMLAVWAALGGMYAAIDAVAGEKERGTLEPLLATPPSRASMVTGKYLVIVVTSVIASGIALLGMYLAFLIKPAALLGPEAGDAIRFSIPLLNVALMLGMAVLLAAFFSAVELSVSAYARSFREAQSYLSPLSIIVVLPALFTQFIPPSDAAGYLYYIPLINSIFVFKELLLGVVDWNHVGTTALWSVIWIVLALRLTSRIFRKESVLFRM